MGWGGDTSGGGCTSGGVEIGGGDGAGKGGSEIFALKVYGDGLPFLRRTELATTRRKGKKKEGPTF